MRIINYGSAYKGWINLNVDDAEGVPAAGSWGRTAFYVLGPKTGLDTRSCDVFLNMEAGHTLETSFSAATERSFGLAPLPADPVAFFGVPTIAGVPLQVLTVEPQGASYLTHMRARIGQMLCVDVWLRWYPDQPGWASGEIIVTASNCSVPDMEAEIPADFRLQMKGTAVIVPGLQTTCLLQAGEVLADGMARSFPFTAIWAERLRGMEDWSSAGNAANFAVSANGIKNLWPGGYPALQAGMSRLGWSRQHLAGAIERLHSWDFGPLGPVAAGGQTGAQEDQVFVGAECDALDGVGAENVRYFVALGLSRRPIHHIEANGDHLDPARHPDLVTWSGRAHWHPVISPDQLGKPRLQNDAGSDMTVSLTMEDVRRIHQQEAHADLDPNPPSTDAPNETHGITGQDRQHWFLNTLAIAARVKNSQALQWQLEHQARLFLFQETIKPGWATSHADSAREIGWAGFVVAHLWRGLANRELAQQVAERWRQRVLRVYIPENGNLPASIWSPINDDRVRAEIGQGWELGWLPDHQSVGAGGLAMACELVGPPEGLAMALAGAKAVLERAYTREGARWVEWERLGYAGTNTVVPVEGQGAHRTGWFISAWFPLAAAVVLRLEPTNERARMIWQQQLDDARGGGSWFWPGLPR